MPLSPVLPLLKWLLLLLSILGVLIGHDGTCHAFIHHHLDDNQQHHRCLHHQRMRIPHGESSSSSRHCSLMLRRIRTASSSSMAPLLSSSGSSFYYEEGVGNEEFGDKDDRDDIRKRQRHWRPWKTTTTTTTTDSDDVMAEWGYERVGGGTNADAYSQRQEHDVDRTCPTQANQVVSEAFDAIAGTLYSQARPDPNIANNARSNSLWTMRPIRSPPSSGRIGIEIDDARLLFRRSEEKIPGMMTEGRALRRWTLLLAIRLATNMSWKDYENKETSTRRSSSSDQRQHDDDDDDDIDAFRPVVVVFNTRKEALSASGEMKLLWTTTGVLTQVERQALSYVQVQSLADDFPSVLLKKKDKMHFKRDEQRHGRKRKQHSGRKVDPVKGLMLVVQPTDFSHEFVPPNPSPCTVSDLQKLVACALIQETPVIVISPRFLLFDDDDDDSYDVNDKRYEYRPIDGVNQQGYQRAGYFGGREPPLGPTPWVLRDFFPPSYCWVGNALDAPLRSLPQSYCWVGNALDAPLRSLPHLQRQQEDHQNNVRVTLTHSVMEENHPWHIFASSTSNDNSSTHSVHLARTRSAAGRPTKEVLGTILTIFQQSLAKLLEKENNE